MKRRLIQDKDGVYMIDEDCIRRKEELERQKEMRWQSRRGQKVRKDSGKQGLDRNK